MVANWCAVPAYGRCALPANVSSVSFYRHICRNASDDKQSSPMNEDLIDRLRAAEEEAQRLKKELAAARAESGISPLPSDVSRTPPARIDGGDLRRETLAFVESKPRNWLSEADVEFFTGGAPSEVLSNGIEATSGGEAGEELLREAQQIIADGNYDQLRAVLSRIEGPPNNVQENLRSAAASLPDARAAEAADYVGRDVFEYIKNIDYQTYYDSPNSAQSRLSEFSSKSAAAAEMKLQEFLMLMPRDQREAAEQQLATLPF